jgi:PAS domain S-box-containing protein
MSERSANRDQFLALANAVPQLVWMADASGSIHWYNRRWYEFTGTTLEEMQGWGWTKVHHPDHKERVIGQLRQCFDTGEPWEDTFPLRGTDGQYRWFLSRAVPIRQDNGSVAGWFGTNTDITEQLKAEEAIRESEQRLRRALEIERTARAEAERATTMRDETLAIVAHDLHNPVHAIMAAAAMLGLQATEDEGRRYLVVVERSAREIERLISDLLDVARIEAGTFALQRASLDPSKLIRGDRGRVSDAGARERRCLEMRGVGGCETDRRGS